MDKRISHLSKEQVEELVNRYYSGDNVKQLIEEYDINVPISRLYTLFPPLEIPEAKCDLCGTSLVADPFSKSGSPPAPKEFYCPQCGHRPFDDACDCNACRAAIEDEEEVKRKLIYDTYVKSKPEVDFDDLDFKDKVYLGALGRLVLCEDMFNINPYDERGTDVELAPTEEMTYDILRRLCRENIIAVSELSNIDAFPGEQDNYPNTYYMNKVMYKLNLVLPSNKKELYEKIFNPDYYNETLMEEAYSLWMEIAKAECVEFLIYELDKVDFDFSPGEKTYQTFELLLHDFSTAQIYGIINKCVSDASKYYLQGDISRKRAANSVIGGCRRYAERAITNNWTLVNYGRRRDLPQSELSVFFYNRVLGIGEKGFNEKPSYIELEKDN